MAGNFGRAFSPAVSGWMQVAYGFGPVYIGVIATYSIAILLYWKFFWKTGPARVVVPVVTD